jgi:post-segregation antitoxin (ccd killing protein)
MPTLKTCVVCGAEFQAKRSALTCSTACSRELARERDRKQQRKWRAANREPEAAHIRDAAGVGEVGR